MIKRLLALLLAALLAVSLAACREEISEPPHEPSAEALTKAIWETILAENRGKYFPGEYQSAGFQVIEALEEEEGILSVYALAVYHEYEFWDGIFTSISGMRTNVLIRFEETENGGYLPLSYTVLDVSSGLSEEETGQLLEPLKKTGKQYLYTDEDLQAVEADADHGAAEYLASIGRTAEIAPNCEMYARHEQEHRRLRDFISDDLFLETLSQTPRLSFYPEWVGTLEKLEDGVRYIYETEYDEAQKAVIYTKTRYDTGEVVAQETVTAEGSAENGA